MVVILEQAFQLRVMEVLRLLDQSLLLVVAVAQWPVTEDLEGQGVAAAMVVIMLVRE